MKFCPKCGHELKPDDLFCKNCGHKVKASQPDHLTQIPTKTPKNNDHLTPVNTPQVKRPQPAPTAPKITNQTHPQKSHKGLLLITLCAAIVLLTVCGLAFYTIKNTQHASLAKTSHPKTVKVASKHHSKKKKDYSSKDWSLMGYMEYARRNYAKNRHVKNNEDLAKTIANDIRTNFLTVTPQSSNAYTVSNKYGSVNINVNKTNVKVADDNTKKTYSKKTLSKHFSKYKNEFQDLESENTKSSSENTKSSSKLSDDELAVALFINYGRGNNPIEKINSTKYLLHLVLNTHKDTLRNEEYISGFIKTSDYGAPCYKLHYNYTGSKSYEIFLNGNKDDVSSRLIGDPDNDPSPTYYSKAKLIQQYSPYKADLDEIISLLNQAEAHKSELSKELHGKTLDDNDDTDTNNDSDSNSDDNDEEYTNNDEDDGDTTVTDDDY